MKERGKKDLQVGGAVGVGADEDAGAGLLQDHLDALEHSQRATR